MDGPSIHRYIFRKAAVQGGTIGFQIQALVEQPNCTGGTLVTRNVWIDDDRLTDKTGIDFLSYLLHGSGKLVSGNDREVRPIVSSKDFQIRMANP
jgi:hypothetical protein